MNLHGGQCVSLSSICDLTHTILLFSVLGFVPHDLSSMDLQVNNIHGIHVDNEIVEATVVPPF